jgi:hypothetical protein
MLAAHEASVAKFFDNKNDPSPLRLRRDLFANNSSKKPRRSYQFKYLENNVVVQIE